VALLAGSAPRVSDYERFEAKYVVLDNGCWEWTACRYLTGYAMFWLNGMNMPAHRASFELYVGPIPDGLQLDHLCHTRDELCAGGWSCLHRRCVNPAHLEPVTHLENVRRGLGGYPALLRARTHCGNGHEFTPENTKLRRDNNGRICRICKREWDRRRQQRRRRIRSLGDGATGPHTSASSPRERAATGVVHAPVPSPSGPAFPSAFPDAQAGPEVHPGQLRIEAA
jgi:hypothetical protein